MSWRVSGVGKILIDGREPRGLRERILAWWLTRQAGLAVRQASARSELTDGQKAAADREESMRICRRRQFLNALTGTCAVVQVPILVVSAHSHQGFWHWVCVASIPFFSYRAVADWRTFRALREEERRLIVDAVHDL